MSKATQVLLVAFLASFTMVCTASSVKPLGGPSIHAEFGIAPGLDMEGVGEMGSLDADLGAVLPASLDDEAAARDEILEAVEPPRKSGGGVWGKIMNNIRTKMEAADRGEAHSMAEFYQAAAATPASRPPSAWERLRARPAEEPSTVEPAAANLISISSAWKRLQRSRGVNLMQLSSKLPNSDEL